MVGVLDTKVITIVGLGLMGGSIAKALKGKKHGEIWAVDKNEQVILQALKDGVIDKDISKRVVMLNRSDIVIVCLYPNLAVKFIKENMARFKKGAVITDICGIKKAVVDELINNLRDDIDFIPAHPMAGSEHQGYECSNKNLFEGCHYIITPLAENSPKSIAIVSQLALLLGAKKIVISNPELHDENIAYTSQIPHALAIAYMHTSNERDILPFAGGSFRDVSRVALINELMWSELFIQNKEKLTSELKKLQHQLSMITDLIENEDAEKLEKYMREGAMIKENYDAAVDD